MSGRWLFYTDLPDESQKHVHARFAFADGTTLWYQDPRRFGVLKVVATEKAMRDPALEILGPDPIANPPDGAALETLARGAKVAVKNFLLDQRRIAGVGNIYASEILHRAGVDPRRRAGTLRREEWNAIARETTIVLEAAIARMGTTFSMYRTLWNEPGSYADRLLVYDRAGEACRNCGTSIRRIVQGQRSTYFCPTCQPRRVASSRPKTAPARRRARPVPA
jgi:formamidopyrimidine-DNA glycosylase